jgi:hypothetical protein
MLFTERRIKSCSAALVVDVACVPCRWVSADYAFGTIKTSPQSFSLLLEELVVTHIFANLYIL